MKTLIKLLLLTVGAVFVVTFIGSQSNGPGSSSARGSAPAAAVPLPQKLATIDAGGYVAGDDVVVARFRSLLRQLDEAYAEDEEQIGNMTIVARDLMRKEGVEESLLNIMEAMNQLFPRQIDGLKYAEYVASYATLRNKGQSHEQATRALQGIIRALLAD